MTIPEQLSHKIYVSKWIYIDGWTAAHLLLGIVIASTSLGNKLFDLFLIPQYSLFTRFMIFSVAFELFEIFANRIFKIRYFKEPNIDIFWDLAANIVGFYVGGLL